MTMARIGRWAATLIALGLAGCATINTISDGADERLMLNGNDPVAYFTEKRPVKGSPDIKTVHEGVVYRFSSPANRDAFAANPARYVPRYGGFCASGMPYALKAKIGAEHFKIVGDRLYLFGGERARRHWEMDEKRNIELGDWYWENEAKDAPYRLQNWKRYVFRVPHYKTNDELEAEWQRRSGGKGTSG